MHLPRLGDEKKNESEKSSESEIERELVLERLATSGGGLQDFGVSLKRYNISKVGGFQPDEGKSVLIVECSSVKNSDILRRIGLGPGDYLTEVDGLPVPEGVEREKVLDSVKELLTPETKELKIKVGPLFPFLRDLLFFQIQMSKIPFLLCYRP